MAKWRSRLISSLSNQCYFAKRKVGYFHKVSKFTQIVKHILLAD